MSRVVRETVERVSRRDSRAFPDDASSLGIGEAVLRRFAGRGDSSKVVMWSDRITVWGPRLLDDFMREAYWVDNERGLRVWVL